MEKSTKNPMFPKELWKNLTKKPTLWKRLSGYVNSLSNRKAKQSASDEKIASETEGTGTPNPMLQESKASKQKDEASKQKEFSFARFFPKTTRAVDALSCAIPFRALKNKVRPKKGL